MYEFKVGDVVERDRVWEGGGLPSGKQGVVSKVVGLGVYIKGFGDWYYLEETLRLVEQDDPLPPAPESVLYIGLQEYYRALRVRRCSYHDAGDVLDLHIGGGVLGDGKSCVLDPDAALQLAHDLNRMANEIKRKEKRNA